MNVTDGWIEKAENNLNAAREALKLANYSDVIQRCQECIELSVKAILDILGIKYRRVHEWDEKEVQKIVDDAQKEKANAKLTAHNLGHVSLGRLIVLSNLWGRFYLPSKYGIEG